MVVGAGGDPPFQIIYGFRRTGGGREGGYQRLEGGRNGIVYQT